VVFCGDSNVGAINVADRLAQVSRTLADTHAEPTGEGILIGPLFTHEAAPRFSVRAINGLPLNCTKQ
jgi:hypothetical protein